MLVRGKMKSILAKIGGCVLKEYYEEYWKKDKILHGKYTIEWKKGLLLSSFSKFEEKKILDIGCGDGFILAPFIKNNDTYGIDVSEHAVKKASILGIKAKVCDLNAEKIPFKNKKFDIVFCLDVLEHIFDPQMVVKSIYDSLVEGGSFAVCVPNMLNIANRIRFMLGDFVDYVDAAHSNETELFSEHIRIFSKAKLEKLLKDAGFKIEKKFFYFPKKMQDWTRLQIFGSILRLLKLHKIFPTFFSLGFLYICSKNKVD